MVEDAIVSLRELNDDAREFLRIEYLALRGEIVKRTEFRERLLEISVVSAAAVLTLNATGIGFSRTLLLYPILIMFVAFLWLYHGLQILTLERYLRTEIEARFRWYSEDGAAELGYETWHADHRRPLELGLDSRASIGVFLGIQVLIYGIGLAAGPPDVSFRMLGGLAIAVTALVLIAYPREPGVWRHHSQTDHHVPLSKHAP